MLKLKTPNHNQKEQNYSLKQKKTLSNLCFLQFHTTSLQERPIFNQERTAPQLFEFPRKYRLKIKLI